MNQQDLVTILRRCFSEAIESLSDARKCAELNLPASATKQMERAEKQIAEYRKLVSAMANNMNLGA